MKKLEEWLVASKCYRGAEIAKYYERYFCVLRDSQSCEYRGSGESLDMAIEEAFREVQIKATRDA